MQSDFPVTRISAPETPGVHTYFDVCPESPSGERVVYFGFTGPLVEGRGEGRVFLTDPDGRDHTPLGNVTRAHSQNGLFQQWVDEDRVIHRSSRAAEGPATDIIDLARNVTGTVEGFAVRMVHPLRPLVLCHVSGVPSGDSGMSARMGSVRLLDIDAGTVDTLFDLDDAWPMHPQHDGREPAELGLYFKHTKWSPDGARFMTVFTNEPWRSPDEMRVKSIYLAEPDGSGLRWHCDFRTHPFWGSDGSAVWALNPDEGGLRVDAMPVDGSPVEAVTRPIRGAHAAVSPDGRFLAVDRFGAGYGLDGEAEVFLYDLASHEETTLARFDLPDATNKSGCHPHPVFSRNSRRVYFNAVEDGAPRFCAVDLPPEFLRTDV